MIVVTGGAGFIGSNVVKALNERGRTDIVVVDDLEDGRKIRALADLDIEDFIDKDDFADRLEEGDGFGKIDAILHQGACSDTMEWNGRYVMKVNYEYSKRLLEWCAAAEVPLIYASSAAVYGDGKRFKEERRYERPINLYAYSKFLFDELVRRRLPELRSPVVGLRYFNVYGPREEHKGELASMAYRLHGQLLERDWVELFEGTDDYANGEQRRDFIWVGDVAAVNLWFLDHPEQSGVFNVGTGRSHSFNQLANAVISEHGGGEIRYVPLPEKLRGRYQSFTEADISALRKAGFTAPFLTVEEAVPVYLRWLRGG